MADAPPEGDKRQHPRVADTYRIADYRLQFADIAGDFELPWNPAKLNQRIGRVNRIGQKSSCVNVVNLIAKHSIEDGSWPGSG